MRLIAIIGMLHQPQTAFRQVLIEATSDETDAGKGVMYPEAKENASCWPTML